MKISVSTTAFILTVLAAVAMLAVIAFSDGIRQAKWIDLEDAGWACFGLAILGAVLGAASFQRPLGKTAAILGTLQVIAFLAQVSRVDDSPAPPSDLPAPVSPAAE